MTTPYLTPPVFSWPAAPGGKLHTYLAGGVVAQATYSDAAGVTPNTNPVTLDSNGSAVVRLAVGVAYHIVLKDSLDVSTLWDADNIDNAYLTSSGVTAAVIGAALYPQTAAELAAGVTPTVYSYPPYDLRRYGADTTGVAASDTAMANAIAVCGATGGVIRAPNGLYSFASQINLASKLNIIIQGDGAPTPGAQPGTRFTYTGTTSPFITLSSAQGCQFKNIQIIHNNAGFIGTYIAQAGTAAFNATIDCSFGTSFGSVLHLDLDRTINFTAERCVFQYGNPSVRGAQVGGFSNVITFRDCEWFNCPVSPIQTAGTGQSWSFIHCTFEKLTTGAPGALFSSASTGVFVGLDISGGCWFGDATATVGTWLDIYTQGFSFRGNYISGNAAGSTAFALRAAVGVAITGNYIDTFLNAINFATATCSNILVKGNVANTVTNKWVNPANVTVGTLDWGANFGMGAPSGHGAPGNANGYEVTPQGLIRQWGFFSATVSGGTVAFNVNGINFPTACTHVLATLSGVGSTANTIYVTSLTTANFTYTIGGAFTNPTTFYWEAKGN